jgi:hypothetical protein
VDALADAPAGRAAATGEEPVVGDAAVGDAAVEGAAVEGAAVGGAVVGGGVVEFMAQVSPVRAWI